MRRRQDRPRCPLRELINTPARTAVRARFASNSRRTIALQRNDAMCHFLTHAPQNLLPFTVLLISPRSRLACGLAKLSRGCSVGRSPDTVDLNPGPADIMSDVWPQMTLTFHLGCACQVRLIGD